MACAGENLFFVIERDEKIKIIAAIILEIIVFI
jgi:hypothetical protein